MNITKSLDDYYEKNPEPSEEEEYEHPAQERVRLSSRSQ